MTLKEWGLLLFWFGGELLVFCGIIEYLELLLSLAGRVTGMLDRVAGGGGGDGPLY